ncbi:hypothetical protein SNEBB_010037 [Seison nebaliae]|nr:hypothetical protein SNEBB_010037 [Seison nebaliae]
MRNFSISYVGGKAVINCNKSADSKAKKLDKCRISQEPTTTQKKSHRNVQGNGGSSKGETSNSNNESNNHNKMLTLSADQLTNIILAAAHKTKDPVKSSHCSPQKNFRSSHEQVNDIDIHKDVQTTDHEIGNQLEGENTSNGFNHEIHRLLNRQNIQSEVVSNSRDRQPVSENSVRIPSNKVNNLGISQQTGPQFYALQTKKREKMRPQQMRDQQPENLHSRHRYERSIPKSHNQQSNIGQCLQKSNNRRRTPIVSHEQQRRLHSNNNQNSEFIVNGQLNESKDAVTGIGNSLKFHSPENFQNGRPKVLTMKEKKQLQWAKEKEDQEKLNTALYERRSLIQNVLGDNIHGGGGEPIIDGNGQVISRFKRLNLDSNKNAINIHQMYNAKKKDLPRRSETYVREILPNKPKDECFAFGTSKEALAIENEKKKKQWLRDLTRQINEKKDQKKENMAETNYYSHDDYRKLNVNDRSSNHQISPQRIISNQQLNCAKANTNKKEHDISNSMTKKNPQDIVYERTIQAREDALKEKRWAKIVELDKKGHDTTALRKRYGFKSLSKPYSTERNIDSYVKPPPNSPQMFNSFKQRKSKAKQSQLLPNLKSRARTNYGNSSKTPIKKEKPAIFHSVIKNNNKHKSYNTNSSSNNQPRKSKLDIIIENKFPKL